MHDTVGFLTEPIFHRLLPCLVAQLGSEVPAAVERQLVAEQQSQQQQQPGMPVIAARQPRSAAVHNPLAATAVGALVQMAQTVNTDTLWKPLNHQV